MDLVFSFVILAVLGFLAIRFAEWMADEGEQ